MSALRGIGASAGVGIGVVLKYEDAPLTFTPHAVEDVVAERQRLEAAISRFREETEQLAKRMDETGADGAILRGHIAMVDDPFLREQLQNELEGGSCAEQALETVCNLFISIFSGADDELTKQRAADVADIKTHVLKLLLGVKSVDLKALPENTVLLVEELTPSMTAALDRPHVAAILTEKGGKTSHAAILSRALKIPAVLSIPGARAALENGETVIVDGETGEIFPAPDAALVARYAEKRQQLREKAAREEAFRGKPTQTADGDPRKVYANIGTPADIDAVLAGDAEGIGLFRTEFLFLDRTAAPDEDEQFDAYKKVALAMHGKEVMIRTLDVGGDKAIPYLGMKREENPFLGFRAVRYCLAHEALYRTQLRAILRASAFGNVCIMIPLVTSLSELLRVRELVGELQAELRAENVAFDENIRIGVMIETPAACLIADLLAKHADFFSIGTNDLTGYIMAADRGNADVGYLYSVYHPAVLRAIQHIIASARQAGIPCGMCGEAAADETLAPLLVAFGLEEFSVNPASALSVRARIAEQSAARCKLIAAEALQLTSAEEVEQYLRREARQVKN